MQKAKNPPKRVSLTCRRTLYESRRSNMFGIGCTQEDYSANASPCGPLLKQRYLPSCYLHAECYLEFYHRVNTHKIWCTQEDSNFRPLGS